jgi:hypothetical protein
MLAPLSRYFWWVLALLLVILGAVVLVNKLGSATSDQLHTDPTSLAQTNNSNVTRLIPNKLKPTNTKGDAACALIDKSEVSSAVGISVSGPFTGSQGPVHGSTCYFFGYQGKGWVQLQVSLIPDTTEMTFASGDLFPPGFDFGKSRPINLGTSAAASTLGTDSFIAFWKNNSTVSIFLVDARNGASSDQSWASASRIARRAVQQIT